MQPYREMVVFHRDDGQLWGGGVGVDYFLPFSLIYNYRIVFSQIYKMGEKIRWVGKYDRGVEIAALGFYN